MIRKLMLLALALTLAFGLLPLFLAFGGSLVAGALGCALDEAVHSCRLIGLEIGGALSASLVLGRFGIITLPVSGMVLVVWIGAALALVAIGRVRRRRRAS